ncbi:hypothetical protein U1Q18_003130 [Sarracenia purpurea var. burkii]
MNMDELLKNIYGDAEAFPASAAENGGGGGGVSLSRQGSLMLSKNVGNKTVDEVWKEIVAGSGGDREPEMTLEDFLTKAGAVREEDVRIPVISPSGFSAADSMMNAAQFQTPPPHMQASQNGPGGYGVHSVGFGNEIDGRMVAVGAGSSGGGVGRGKRRSVEEPPMDKVTQQKQRRMIKNRESAARSRERKQAYTVELESLVMQLEEENARLMREEAEQSERRLKQLLENLIPVVEQRRPPRALRRVHSMCW